MSPNSVLGLLAVPLAMLATYMHEASKVQDSKALVEGEFGGIETFRKVGIHETLGGSTSCQGSAVITSCDSSSRYARSSQFDCRNAYDGSTSTEFATFEEGVGGWIQLNFSAPTYINTMAWTNRNGDPIRLVRLTFDDGSSQEPNQNLTKSGQGNISFNAVTTTSVRVEFLAIWYSSKNNGAKELSFSCQASTHPSAVGDPHLTNLRGDKFDIHDGMHRLVHYPRGVSEAEALLIVDAQAVDMGHEANCYSVYLQTIRISGKWIGEDIVTRADTNSSAADSSLSALRVSFADEQVDWPFVAKHRDVRLDVHGIMPVEVNARMRKAAGEDAMGGEEITFKIGDQHPVLVEVWSSHGANQLTHGKEVRYLNVEVQNLPEASGGILGLDSYSRPSSSQCDLIQEERSLMDYIETDKAILSLERLSRPKWTASATALQY